MGDIVLAGSTSGTVTISPPAVAGTTTLTLPTTNGTVYVPGGALGTPASGTLTNCTGYPASALPTGSVLQVVQSSYSTFTSSSSSTYADTGLSASITPSSSSNKILVFASMVGVGKYNGNTKVGLMLVRNSTNIENFSTETASSGWNSTTQVDVGTTSCVILDSPATTSSTTYKVQLASSGNVSYTFINNVNGSPEIGCTLTLMEIKG